MIKMTSKVIIVVLILTLLGLTQSCNLSASLPTVPTPLIKRGSGNMISEERTISEFNTLSISGGGEVKLVQDDEYKLIIEAEDNILPHITSEMDEDHLTIGYDETLWKDRVLPTKNITYTLTFPNLKGITLQGGAKIEGNDLDLPELTLEINGGANINLNRFKTDALTIQLDGGANISINGEAASQSVIINGASKYKAENLRTSETDIEINGAANAKVWAIDTLDVRINGVGSVSYYGNPTITKDIQGLGTVTSLGEK